MSGLPLLPSGCTLVNDLTAGLGIDYAAMLSADKVKFPTVAALKADVAMSYTSGPGLILVGSGDVIEAGGCRYSVAASGASNHHITNSNGVKLYVLPDAAGWPVRALGLDRTGATDVTTALRMLHNAAGAGATMLYEFGAVYQVSSGILTPANQIVRGQYATLKRRDQIITTTTTAMTTGVTNTVTLADATGFAVGMQVAFAQVGVARSALVYGTTLSAIRTITNIVGNEITLNAAVDINASIGSTCALTFVPLTLGAGAVAEHVKTDGNRANWPWARWEVTAEMMTDVTGHGQSFVACSITEAPGEGISVYSNEVIIQRNRMTNLGGNGIHLSGSTGTQIVGNIAYNGNIDIDVGHQDGFVCVSNEVYDTLVSGNRARQWIAGVGAFNATNTDMTIADNTFRDMYCFGVEGGSSAARLVMIGNRIVNVATDTAKKPGIPYYGALIGIGLTGESYTISNNHLGGMVVLTAVGGKSLALNDNVVGGELLLAGWAGYTVDDNEFAGRIRLGAGANGSVSRNIVDLAGNTSLSAIGIYDSGAYNNVSVSDNIIVGGNAGLQISSSVVSLTGVSIERNKLQGQATRGILVDNATATVDLMRINGNEIKASSESSTSWVGILTTNAANTSIRRNNITNLAGAAGSRLGIRTNITTASKVLLEGNEVRGPWSADISLTENAGIHVINNIVDGTISGSTGNTVQGTVTI